MAIPPRSIVREEEFEAQLAALLVNLEEADEYTAAAEWILAAEPEIGLPASADGTIWALSMAPVRGRKVTLYYSFDAVTVHLRHLVAWSA